MKYLQTKSKSLYWPPLSGVLNFLNLPKSGRSSAVERHLAKVDVESSILFARSISLIFLLFIPSNT